MVIIFGLGFTGRRLARRLLDRGVPVFAAARQPGRFRDLADAGLQLGDLSHSPAALANFPQNAAIFYSIPPLPIAEAARVDTLIEKLQPSRIVYISSTAVYGDQLEVNEATAAKPSDDRGRHRLADENRLTAGPWTSLILRAAAIYGPGRGVHTAVREGRLPRGIGSGLVSRIHVEDLAALAEAGLFSDLQGAWPIADDLPCPSSEIVAGTAKLLNLEIPGGPSQESRIAGRKVDGRKIREKLAVKLKYPTWETGVPASIAEELASANV